jgi:hypothetical protein
MSACRPDAIERSFGEDRHAVAKVPSSWRSAPSLDDLQTVAQKLGICHRRPMSGGRDYLFEIADYFFQI